jgi:hypothetical protein
MRADYRKERAYFAGLMVNEESAPGGARPCGQEPGTEPSGLHEADAAGEACVFGRRCVIGRWRLLISSSPLSEEEQLRWRKRAHYRSMSSETSRERPAQ